MIYSRPEKLNLLTPKFYFYESDYKLIFDRYVRLIIYDIENDPFENNELSKSYLDLTKELFTKFKSV